MYKKIKLLGILTWLAAGVLHAQTDNSPYSRYGLGDELSGKNIMSRGVGGLSAAYADILTVNFSNPASYSRLKRATFDFGVELDARTLRVIDPPQKYSSATPTISYIQLGLPLSKTRNWGMNIGLKPLTRVSYKLERNERLDGVDSLQSVFEGNGGSYEVYTGTGFGTKNIAIGFNVGYRFGTKSYDSKRIFIPDSVGTFYYPSLYNTRTSYGGLFGNAGIQYTALLNKKNILRIGAYGSLKRELNATRDETIQTYSDEDTGVHRIDLVSQTSMSGKIVYPASYGMGIIYHKGEKWMIGVDFTQTQWNEYRYFNEVDSVQDAWKVHIGGQVLPNLVNAKSYWGRVTYRAGFSYGQDYVKVQNDLPIWTGSVGLGLPMRPPSFSNQYSVINLSLEFGQRGNNLNVIRESFFRLSLGFTLSDIWFIKRKYD